jgi:hypothetical protein
MTSYSDERDLGATRNRLLTFLLGKNTTGRPLVKPYGLALADRRLYVCDSVAAAVEILDLERKEMDVFSPRGRGRLATPIHIAVDRDGTRYVADTGRSLVLIYGKDDAFRGALGGKDEMKPCDVAITADRLLLYFRTREGFAALQAGLQGALRRRDLAGALALMQRDSLIRNVLRSGLDAVQRGERDPKGVEEEMLATLAAERSRYEGDECVRSLETGTTLRFRKSRTEVDVGLREPCPLLDLIELIRDLVAESLLYLDPARERPPSA